MPALSKPNYGLDAPKVIRNLILGGALMVLAGAVIPILRHSTNRLTVLTIVRCLLILEGLVMIWSSLIGKLKLRDHLLRSLSLATNRCLMSAVGTVCFLRCAGMDAAYSL
ncbi:MAG: hypothetical protein H6729_06495 [Deltaproteobacteria bacterium]|nr:hypothetical protein [Deltaproteobacteria bacterium]